jgi:hypothetical protein
VNHYDEWLITEARQRLDAQSAEIYIWHRWGRNGSEPLSFYAIASLKGIRRQAVQRLYLHASETMGQVIEISHRASQQYVPAQSHAPMEETGAVCVTLTIDRNGETETVTDGTAQTALRRAS